MDLETNINEDQHYDVVIIGAGAAGFMCAIEAGKRGKTVWLIDHASKIGEKIRIAGGGRCNFTNLHARPEAFLSTNKHFCKSALSQYTQQDFISLVEAHDIGYHEKDNSGQKLGQLFCDDSSKQIINMLLSESQKARVKLQKETSVESIEYRDDLYHLITSRGTASCTSLVIATGGLSIPKIGASKFGYDIAKQFGLKVTQTAPALVPLTFQNELLARCKALSGISVNAEVSFGKTHFREGLLFTHRGLSGPSILQISSYWKDGKDITVNLSPDTDAYTFFKDEKQNSPKQNIQTILAKLLPQRLADDICAHEDVTGRIADLADKKLQQLATAVNGWRITPSGTEGYRTAEVTLGGVDTDELSSKTMECKHHKGLYFIGEVIDVTGHLGGYNFQWAWSSGYVAGQHV